MRRVSDLAGEIGSGLGKLRADVATSEAATHLATADTALADLMAVDKRARQALDNDQRFLAADIIFAEGLNPTQTLIDSVTGTASSEIAAAEARLTSESRVRLVLMPTALLLVIGAALAWAQSMPREPASSATASMAQMLRDLPPPVKSAVPPAPNPARAPASTAAMSPADLAEAAELCVDLARVLSASDMPALLGRVVSVLGANGLVVWAASDGGDTLAPALWYGYSDRVIAKMGRLDASAENMTSVCYRTRRTQSMPGVGQPGATSALAVPLVTSEGCQGVLAAELHGAKATPETIALARIVAAQFASMVGPAELGENRVDVAVG